MIGKLKMSLFNISPAERWGTSEDLHQYITLKVPYYSTSIKYNPRVDPKELIKMAKKEIIESLIKNLLETEEWYE